MQVVDQVEILDYLRQVGSVIVLLDTYEIAKAHSQVSNSLLVVHLEGAVEVLLHVRKEHRCSQVFYLALVDALLYNEDHISMELLFRVRAEAIQA